MNQAKWVIGILVGTVVVLVGVGMLLTRLESKTVDEAMLVGDARLATGSAKPKVTIVEWSDFQCPACRQAQPVVKEILAQYPEEVRLIYRHFPLTQIHEQAMAAAQIAEAAAAEGKFWEAHDLLFERQDEWAENRDKLEEYKSALEISDKRDYGELINADIRDGRRLGINATPTFFVNGKKVNVIELKSIVEALIRSAQ